MPKIAKNLLSELTIRNAKPQVKTLKLRDGAGLFMVIEPSGKKWWKFRGFFAGKETSLSFGSYPSVTLAQARAKRDEANSRIANGIDPAAFRRSEKAILAGEGSFEQVSREWHKRFLPTWSELYGKTLLIRLERMVFPYIGRRPTGEVTAPEVLAVLRRIEKKSLETAHRMRILIGQVFRYAVATGYASSDPTTALKGALPQTIVKSMAAPTDPKKIGPLLRMLDGYQGTFVVACALKLSPLVFVRPGELRQALWADIDLEKKEWRYVASKTAADHIVPLSTQAVSILNDLHPLTGQGHYVFPSARTSARPMSNNTINAALRRMGIDTQNELTAHGFRAMARTVLEEELDVRPEVIELQLAHAIKDPNGVAYNRTKHLKKRIEMMQIWADYLDKLKAVAEIIPIRNVG